MGEYGIEADVFVSRPGDDVMGWLVAPDRMRQWIVGADRADPVSGSAAACGSVVRLTLSSAGGQFRVGQTYLGEITELSESRLVRRYWLERSQAGVVRLTDEPGEYERTVTYELRPAPGGVQVHCTARTVIPGLSPAVARIGGHAETRSLRRSLDRLRLCAEGGQLGLLARVRDGGQSAQAL